MSTSSESWSLPGSGTPRTAAVAAVAAVVVFAAAWAGLHTGFYRHSQIVDTPTYQRYGDAMRHGQVPYRDFQLEYPPAALPVFVIPSLLRSQDGDLSGYRQGFEAEMLVCGALVLLFMLSVLLSARGRCASDRRGAGLRRTCAAPARLGRALPFRPVAGRADDGRARGLRRRAAAARRRRARAGGRGEALPGGARPASRRSGSGGGAAGVSCSSCAVVFAAVLALCFGPFVALSPHGVWHAVTTQTSRPLQIETLGAGVLLVAHAVGGLGITMRSGHGSQNLAGRGPDALATVQTVLQAAALIVTWVWFARGPATRERLVRASAAAVCAFVAFGKVLSPQFLIWLVPLVPLVWGRRGHRRKRAARGGARPDAALVPVPLLGPRPPLRDVPVVARADPGPGPRRALRRADRAYG